MIVALFLLGYLAVGVGAAALFVALSAVCDTPTSRTEVVQWVFGWPLAVSVFGGVYLWLRWKARQ